MRISLVFYLVPIIVLSVLVIMVPNFFGAGFLITILYTIFLFTALAESWNLIGGYTGQPFIGAAAFWGIGGYASVISYSLGVPLFLCIPIGGLVAACLAIVLSPTFRLRGVYFAVGSIFLPEIVKVLVLRFREITGGSAGFYPPPIQGRVILTYYLSFFLMLISVIFVWLLANSKVGLALKAIRDDEEAAEMLGVKCLRLKLLSLVLCAMFTGMAGGVHGFYLSFLEPYSVFNIMWSIVPMFMVIIGGIGTILGPVIGAVLYTFMKELFTSLGGEAHLAILGILLIIIMLFMPKGISSLIGKIIKTSREKTQG